jgi:serine phosphatase RsbU (regulator of sigma subunit)
MLGEENLVQMIESLPLDGDPISEIQNKIKNFSNDQFEDDISLIAIKRV